MKEKIESYVRYQLRFDTRDGIEELIEEITANLLDRFDDLVKKGKTEDEAYIEAIKSMGDFSNNALNEVAKKYAFKPSLSDTVLILSTVLSIFGLILVLLNTVVGTLITALSILFFVGAGYYLYSYSQYVRKEEMDIKKHNWLLTKLFKNMKLNFTFWAISLSLIFTKIIVSFITLLVLASRGVDLMNNVNDYISYYILIFIVLFIVIINVIFFIYYKLFDHYTLLTGKSSLDDADEGQSPFKSQRRQSLSDKGVKRMSLIPVYLGIIQILFLCTFQVRYLLAYQENYTMHVTAPYLHSLFDVSVKEIAYPISVGLVTLSLIITIVLRFIEKMNHNKVMIPLHFLLLVVVFAGGTMLTTISYQSEMVNIMIINGVVLSILLFIYYHLSNKFQIKERYKAIRNKNQKNKNK